MADLFLHLPFARRLRFADGLHPLAGEAIGRRPSLVVLGASLACLPENERRGMSWFRRLFSGGGEAARWQKLLAPTPGQPHVDMLVSLLAPEDAALGPLARFALGLGLLSHEILEEKIGGLTATLQGPQRAAVERAQARLWLQSAVPGHLEQEWKPALDLADADANKRALAHVDRALKRVHGSGPGEAALARWLKGLAAEVGPLADGRGAAGALPPPLSLPDHDARGPHFEQVGFVEKAQGAVTWIVAVANRLGEAFTKGNPDRAAITDAVGKLTEPGSVDLDGARDRWKTWLKTNLAQNQERGRNPKPAYSDNGVPLPEHKLGSLTGVMRLSDLPPEVAAAGAPPVPEQSGPVPPFPPPPPTSTQEVSLAQIEAEARAAGEFQAPAHTQEVSVAQIEELASVQETPDSTQEVQTSQVVADDTRTTQPISREEIERQNAADEAERARAAAAAQPAAAEDAAGVAPPPPPAPPPSTEPPQPAATSAEDAAAATAAQPNGQNGTHAPDAHSPEEDGAKADGAKADGQDPADPPAPPAEQADASPAAAQPEDPPRE